MARRRTLPMVPPAAKAVKKKAVTKQLIEPEHSIYGMLATLIEETRHQHLANARIAILWNMSVPREEADGRAQIYKVKLCSEQERELAPFDFAIAISHQIWNQRFKEAEMKAMLDESLCRFGVFKDKNNETKLDEKDRPVYRLCKPDVVTFRQNVSRFGLWRPEVGELIESVEAFNDRQRPLLASQSTGQKGQGFHEPAMGSGGGSEEHPGDETVSIHKKGRTRKAAAHG